jgi:redox-sensitive bicupin YhaK (pirin superfamily)
MAGPITHEIPGNARDLGGFSVARVLPSTHRRTVGPFIFFDHIGPAQFAAGAGIDVRPHPHIGLATVTYLFEGALMHRDSLGNARVIEPGAVNWMTAGRGITHSERTPPAQRASGQPFHGIQSWVALPQSAAECEPSFVHHPAETLPEVSLPGAQLTVIAGSAYGAVSPVHFPARILYVAARLKAGASLELPAEWGERAVYTISGSVTLDGTPVAERTMAVLADGGRVRLTAVGETHLMLVGGESVDAPRHVWWNFVSHDQARIEQAKADWREGRFPPVPGETEFIPLPEDPPVTIGKGAPTT